MAFEVQANNIMEGSENFSGNASSRSVTSGAVERGPSSTSNPEVFEFEGESNPDNSSLSVYGGTRDTDVSLTTWDAQNLHQYADRLTKLAQLLDTRAASLDTTELRLAQQQAALNDRQAKLHSIESHARQQVSLLLSDIATRQSTLASRETRLQDAKSILASRLQAARPILAAAAQVARQLPVRKDELGRMRASLDDHSAALADARAALADANTRKHHAVAEATKFVEERSKLQRIGDRLESMEQSLLQRENNLSEREASLQKREDHLSTYTPLQRLVPPLQLLLDDLSSLNLDPADSSATPLGATSLMQPSPDVSANPSEAVHFALQLLSSARKQLIKFSEQRAELQTQRESLENRAKKLATETTTLFEAKSSFANDERTLAASQRANERFRAEVETNSRALDDARTQLDVREESLIAREARVIAAEDDVSRRERSVATLEQTLSRKERSLKRGLDAVVERERVVNRRLKDLEIEKGSIDCLRRDVQLREGLLHTKELELAARESYVTTEAKSVLKSEANHSIDQRADGLFSAPSRDPDNLVVSPARPGEPNYGLDQPTRQSIAAMQSENQQLNRIDGNVRFEADGRHVENESQTEVPRNIRRQLAFESSIRNMPQTPSEPLQTVAVESVQAPTFIARSNVQSQSALSTNPHPQVTRMTTTIVDTEKSIDNAVAGDSTTARPDEEDAESEAAAEQLLPELVSARAVWKERISRLEEVVHNTQQQSWTVRPHLQPVLIRVSDELKTLQSEIDQSPTVSGVSGLSAKGAYVHEQKIQRRWGEQLQVQLGTVREVQTGMLIGLREKSPDEEIYDDEGVEPTTGEIDIEVPAQQYDLAEDGSDELLEDATDSGDTNIANRERFENLESRQYVRGSLIDNSRKNSGDGSGTGSIEATLDATATLSASVTVSSGDEHLPKEPSMTALSTSFTRFRQQLRQRQSTLGPEMNLGPFPDFRTRLVNNGPTRRNVVTVSPRRDTLLLELTSLRNELSEIPDVSNEASRVED